LKPELVRRDKEGYFIIMKEAIHQEEITIVNLYVPNVGAPNVINHATCTTGLKNTDSPQHTGGGRLQYSSIPNR
jgi:hypothetical protein